MAGSHGNRHILKESEVEAMEKAGTWSAWIGAALFMSKCHPSAGEFEVTIIEDKTGVPRPGWSPTRRLLDLASLAELRGVTA